MGSNEELRGRVSGGSVVRDLASHTLLPGFHDSHNHMLPTDLNLVAVDLSGARSVADVVRAIGQRASGTPDQWVLSSARWHESQLAERRFPHRDELDRVAAGRPVLLQRGGHNVVANTRALELAAIEPDVANPPGGTFVRDAAGGLTGHAIGAAAQLIRAGMPDPPERLLHEVLLRIERAYNAAGITSVIDPVLSAAQIRAYRSLASAGQPTVHASLMWRLDPGFGDQALQSALDELRSADVLEAFCIEAARLGWQVGAHCVGDAAIDATLSAFEAADQAATIVGRRWTLIHMMLAREDHWARANRLGLIVTAQQPLLYTLAEGFLKYVGPDRTRAIEPLRMYLARSEQPVGGGSDTPVTPYEPLLGI